MSLQPANQPLTVYVGGTWNQQFQFWDDAAQTQAHSFSGWTITATFSFQNAQASPPISATVAVSSNVVTVSLTSTQTASIANTNGHWVLSMSNGASPPDIEFLMSGAVSYITP